MNAKQLFAHVVQGSTVQAERDDLVHQHKVYGQLLGRAHWQYAVHIPCTAVQETAADTYMRFSTAQHALRSHKG